MSPLTYELPLEKIAVHPLINRSDSKLLVYRDGVLKDISFRNIVDELPSDTLLVRNISRVIPARIIADSGDEIFLIEPKGVPYDSALQTTGSICWQCLVSNPQKKPVIYEVCEGVYAEVRRETGGHHVYFSWEDGRTFGDILKNIGHVPLPPYIERADTNADHVRYQTTFASVDGSVAAPTASLHFTDEIFEQLKSKGVEVVDVILHVGLGTFMPIIRTIDEHIMHREFFEVSPETLGRLTKAYGSGRPVVCIGTTAFRVVESLAWAHIWYDENTDIQEVSQWAWKNQEPDIDESLNCLSRRDVPLVGYTNILCTREYEPQLVSGIITNFHQPSSTLLELVASCIGSDWQIVYQYALGHGYRFLSYGDASLLWRTV